MSVDLGALRSLEARLVAGEIPAESLPLLLEAVRHLMRCGHARSRTNSSTERRRPRQRARREPKGHGRNAAEDYTGATRVPVPHPTLKEGDPCPGCRGKLYAIDPSPHVELTAA